MKYINIILKKIDIFFKERFEIKYKESGFRFKYTNKFGIKTYVHPEKLFDIIETNTSCDAEPMLEALDDKINNVGVALDVGANIGIVSIWLSRRAKRVYSFEPDTSNAEFARHNLKLNNVSNVDLRELAVGKQSGQADFHVRESFGHHGMQPKHITKVSQTRKVDVVTLDEFCSQNEIQEISVLKIDTEGGELDALTGFENYLSNNKVKMIIFEHAPVLLESDRDSRLAVFNYLTNFGYKIYSLDHHVMSQNEMAVVSQGDFYAIIT